MKKKDPCSLSSDSEPARKTKGGAGRGEGAADIMVLGLGNILLSDEGAGVRVVEKLQKRYLIPVTVDVVDGGTMGMELLPYLDGRRHVIIIDAVRGGHRPGTVVRIEDPPAFLQKRISPHHIGLGDVLAFATLSGDRLPGITLFGIEPGRVRPGLEMSAAVAAGVDLLVDKVVAQLRAMGIRLVPAPPA